MQQGYEFTVTIIAIEQVGDYQAPDFSREHLRAALIKHKDKDMLKEATKANSGNF